MALAYWRSRDALHPMVILGPFLIYVFVVRPLLLTASGELDAFLSISQMAFAQTLFMLGIVLLCAGLLYGISRRPGRIRFETEPRTRRRLVYVACLLGTLAVLTYSIQLTISGGLFAVYSRRKAYLSSTGSGWIDELVNLSIPAVALLLLAWQGQRGRRHYLFLALLFASPLLIHGFLGARRGPTFIILATFLVAWYIGSGRRISLWKVVTRFAVIGVLLVFLVSQRHKIYLGSDFSFGVRDLWNALVPTEVSNADDTVFAYGSVNVYSATGTHYWGLRYATTYLIRPIPRQLWPTKYEDLGLGWMATQRDVSGIGDAQWREVLGWIPVRGSAVGFVGDLFLEFSWPGLLGCLALGRFFGWLWTRAREWGSVWTLLYIEAIALSVYVATQSVSAVFHRFLFLALPTWLLWRFYIGSDMAVNAILTRRRLVARIARNRRIARLRLLGANAWRN
jgi:oligosaccharide repeat unit polymerase